MFKYYILKKITVKVKKIKQIEEKQYIHAYIDYSKTLKEQISFK